MRDVKSEVSVFYALCSGDKYKDFINTQVDSQTRKMVRAILDIMEIDEISVANAKLIFHLCEDIIERCVAANTTKDA